MVLGSCGGNNTETTDTYNDTVEEIAPVEVQYTEEDDFSGNWREEDLEFDDTWKEDIEYDLTPEEVEELTEMGEDTKPLPIDVLEGTRSWEDYEAELKRKGEL